MVRALHVPIETILKGRAADADAGAIAIAITKSDARTGYDAISGTVRSGDEHGITDPVSSMQQAVLAAASMAGLVLMTEVLISAQQK